MEALEEIIGRVKNTDPALHKRALEELHILKLGEHYDEQTALEAVEFIGGEHWSIERVILLTEPHTMRFDACDTIWDAYVAMNMWWNTLGGNYAKRGLGDAEIAEDAVTWAFCDEYSRDGKIWKHIHAMI